MKTRAAKYRRISEDREGREAGVTRQDEDLDALAARCELEIVADYLDNDLGASTRSRKPRPDYQRMLADAKAGKFDTIIAYTSGRLTRRPREHEDLIELAEQHGIRYEFVRSPSFDLNTATGRRVARILAANDAGEAEDIAERVSRAAEQRAKVGLYHGGRRTFGYEANGMRLVPAEAAALARAAHDLLAGVSLAAAVRRLDADAVPTVTGSRWGPSSLRTMLLNPRIAGLAVHRGQIVGRGSWPAIITEEEHHALVALLSDPGRRNSPGNQAAYLLSGWATCAVCGSTIRSSGATRSKRGGNVRYLYRCRPRGCVGRRRDWADEYIADVIVERLSRPDAAELLVDHNRPDVPALQEESRALRLRLDDLAADYADGSIDRTQLRAGTDRARRRLAEIEQAMRHVSRAPVLADLVDADDVRAVWDNLGLERRRAVARALMDVRLHPGGSGLRERRHVAMYVEVIWRDAS